jgi:hypothetical protein
LIDRVFREWTSGKDPVQARIAIYEKTRDIPYAVVPELVDYKKYADILKLGRGSCTPKHFLLAEMYQRLGLLVLFCVYPYRWGERSEIMDNYPPLLKELAERQPIAHHIACKVEINGRLVLVDATLDKPLAKLSLLPVNVAWDGFSDTLLPVTPIGEEMIFHPLEAPMMLKPALTPDTLAFNDLLNRCMEEVRKGKQIPLRPPLKKGE